MAYTKVAWTELVPITPANLDTMDTGIDEVHTSDYRRGGRILVGYYDRTAGFTTSIEMPIPVWAQGYLWYELVLSVTATGAETDMPACRLLFNTTSVTGNTGVWQRMEEWRANAGDGTGGVFSSSFSDNEGVVCRLGSISGTARVQITRSPGSAEWIASSVWSAYGATTSSATFGRIAQGMATSARTVTGTNELTSILLWAEGGSVDFGSGSRAALYAIPRPGIASDESDPGVPS